jgi:hypothetical protein
MFSAELHEKFFFEKRNSRKEFFEKFFNLKNSILSYKS